MNGLSEPRLLIFRGRQQQTEAYNDVSHHKEQFLKILNLVVKDPAPVLSGASESDSMSILYSIQHECLLK